MRVQRKNKKLYILITSLIVVLLLIGTYFAYAFFTKTWPFAVQGSNKITSASSRDTNSINYSPPTDQEKASSQDGKKNSESDTKATAPTSKTVTFMVSYAGVSDDKTSIEVDAYTPDVIEGTGTCIATFTSGSQSVTGQSNAMVDASSSICQPILIPLSKFPTSGSWHLIVKYSSPSYSGTSQAIDVRVDK